MVATKLASIGEPTRSTDQRITLHGVPWSHYEVMLAILGDAGSPRLAYLKGDLELMSPSLEHEAIKSILRQLIEAAAREFDIDLWPVGSWTVRNAAQERGVEPDECYTVGNPRQKDVPDLAIEVVWTSGGIDKLEIYRGLGVSEVWIWCRDELTAFVLRNGEYQRVEQSALLPQLDLTLVAKLVHASPREALRQLREACTPSR